MSRIVYPILVSLSFGLVSITAHAADPKPVATVVKIAGEVFVLDKTQRVVASVDGKSNRRKLADGAPIFSHETLQTRADGRVKLQFTKDGNEIVIGQNSSLLVQEGGETSNTKLELKSGSVRSTVKGTYETPEGYQVKTPNAVAGVRGTIFTVFYDAKKDTTSVATEKGSVEVSNGKGKVLVNAGTFSSLKANQAPSEPKKLSENPALNKQVEAVEDTDGTADAAAATSSGGTAKKEGDEAPPVALAPEPVKEDGGRAPASEGAAPAPKVMGSGGEGSSGFSSLPFDRATSSANDARSNVDSTKAYAPPPSAIVGDPTVRIKIE